MNACTQGGDVKLSGALVHLECMEFGLHIVFSSTSCYVRGSLSVAIA